MAKLREIAENEPGDEEGAEEAPEPTKRLPPQYPDDEERIRAALRKLPPDARTRVKRLNETTKRREMHGFLSPEEATSEYISRRFGGGRYLVEVMHRNEGGQEVCKTSATWDIPGPYKGVGRGLPGIDDVVQPGPGGGEPGEPATVSNRVPTRELMDNAMASRFMDILSHDRQPGMDWTGVAAMVAAVGTIISPVLVKLFERVPDPMVEEMRNEFRALRDKPGPASTALHDALAGVRDVMRLRDMVDGGGKGGEGKTSMEERIVSMVPDILAAFTGKGVPAVPAAPQTNEPGVGLVDTRPPVPAQGADGTPPWDRLLLSFRDQLLYMANNGWEAEYCAELVQRALPAEYVGLLVEFLQKPDAEAREITVRAIPELGAFEKWVPAFLAELRRLMLPEATDANDANDK